MKAKVTVLEDNLVAGDIILLWRINFGTFTNETWIPKYFKETYGIDAKSNLNILIGKGYVYEENSFNSLKHINSEAKKNILKKYGVKGLYKMRVNDLDEELFKQFSEDELGLQFNVRGYSLTKKGEIILAKYKNIVDKHPKKMG